jgi:RNA polymerase sigma-70 factor (ECF subfamily)
MAIVLFHYAGLSIDEIAAETRMTPSAVKARLARARKALAPHLSESAEGLDKPLLPRMSYQPESRRREN